MYPTYVLKKGINDIDEDISGVVKVVVIEILFISIKSFTEILVSLALASIFLWTAYPDVRLGTTSLDIPLACYNHRSAKFCCIFSRLCAIHNVPSPTNCLIRYFIGSPIKMSHFSKSLRYMQTLYKLQFHQYSRPVSKSFLKQ